MTHPAIALADGRPPSVYPDELIDWAFAAEQKLRELVSENVYLKTGYDASRLEVESLKGRVDQLGRIARENRSRAVIDLEVQIGKLDFAIECYEKDLDTIKAALSTDKYPGSKDWRESSTLERIQWLHDYCQGGREEIERLTIDVLNLQAMLAKANNQAEHFERHWYLRGDEIESLQAMLDAVGAGGVEPLRRGKCLHQVTEPPEQTPEPPELSAANRFVDANKMTDAHSRWLTTV